MKGTLWEKIFRKKSLAVPKKMKGGPFGLARYDMLRGKTGKPFWLSSMGQIVQFGAIIFCRTYKNYFSQFVWIEKISLHEAPTQNTLLCFAHAFNY